MTVLTVLAVTWNDNEAGHLWEALWCREDGRYLKKLCVPGVFLPPTEFATEAAFWSAFEAERDQFKGRITAWQA